MSVRSGPYFVRMSSACRHTSSCRDAMSIHHRGHFRGRWLIKLVVMASLFVLPRASVGDTVGRLTLNVRGTIRDVVLVDPLGRSDRYTSNIEQSTIPDCDRWPGGTGGELDAAEDHSSDLLVFILHSVLYGRYVVYAQADSLVEVSVFGTFEPADTAGHGCVNLGRTGRVGVGRHAWAVDVRRSPPKGECAVRITPLQKKK